MSPPPVCYCLATVQTLSVRTHARLFALCVSDFPHFQLSNGAFAVQIRWVVAELVMFLDYMALWTCKGRVSDSKTCNYYSFGITTAVYTSNTVLLHPVHPPCHPFAMQYVSPSYLSLFGNCSNNVRTFQYICAGLFALWVSGAPHRQPSNGASAVQIGGVAAELFMFLVMWHCELCKGAISDSNACNHYSLCIATAVYTGNTILLRFVHLPCHPFAMQYVSPSPPFKVFEHFPIFVLNCSLCGFQVPLVSSIPMVPLPSKSAEWLLSYSCF